MALGKYPRSQVHLDVQRINLTGFKITWFGHRFPLRTIQSRARNLRDRTVGSHVGKPREPIRQRRGRRSAQQCVRTAENRYLVFQRRRIINETECVHRPRIAQQFSPPEASLDANCGNVFQLMRCLNPGSSLHRVILM